MSGVLFRKSWLDIFPLLASLSLGSLLVYLSAIGVARDIPDIFSRILVFGVTIWWISNTVSHIHLHTRLFKRHWINNLYDLFLTLLTSIPQSLWRFRHLQHHAPHRILKFKFFSFIFLSEITALIAFWAFVGYYVTPLVYFFYFPGLILGLCLCHIQGYFEHHQNGKTIHEGLSFYHPVYNLIFFNDGHHVEHHMKPTVHWSRIPRLIPGKVGINRVSFPPVLGWLPSLTRALNAVQAYLLIKLENQIFHFPKLQQGIISCHKIAINSLMDQYQVPIPEKICVIGGGGFPRTAILLRQLYPLAKIAVIDRCFGNLILAKRFLQTQNPALRQIQLCQGIADATHLSGFDLVCIPLGFKGDKNSLVETSSANSKTVYLMHDWIWRFQEKSIPVSWWLLKRISLHRVIGCS